MYVPSLCVNTHIHHLSICRLILKGIFVYNIINVIYFAIRYIIMCVLCMYICIS